MNPTRGVVGIGEGQFFYNALVDVATQLSGRGVRVIITAHGYPGWQGTSSRLMVVMAGKGHHHGPGVITAGLDQDYTGKP